MPELQEALDRFDARSKRVAAHGLNELAAVTVEDVRPRFHRTLLRSGSSSGADPAGRTREAQPRGRPMQRLTLCACEVDAEPVFDALDAEWRRALGVLNSYLACPAWEAEMLAGGIPALQVLADRLIAAGYAGMRVRSFAVGAGVDDLDLVMWTRSAERPARVVLIDSEKHSLA